MKFKCKSLAIGLTAVTAMGLAATGRGVQASTVPVTYMGGSVNATGDTDVTAVNDPTGDNRGTVAKFDIPVSPDGINNPAGHVTFDVPLAQQLELRDIRGSFDFYVDSGNGANHTGNAPYMYFVVDTNEYGTVSGGGNAYILFAEGYSRYGTAPSDTWYTSGLNGTDVIHVAGSSSGLDSDFSSGSKGNTLSELYSYSLGNGHT